MQDHQENQENKEKMDYQDHLVYMDRKFVFPVFSLISN